MPQALLLEDVADKENERPAMSTPVASKASVPLSALRSRLKALQHDETEPMTGAVTPRQRGAESGLRARADKGSASMEIPSHATQALSTLLAKEELECARLPPAERQARLVAIYHRATQAAESAAPAEREKIWLRYAMIQAEASADDARDAFRHMKVQGIGSNSADFYLTWARFEANQGDFVKAQSLLLKARERGERLDQDVVTQALDQLQTQRRRAPPGADLLHHAPPAPSPTVAIRKKATPTMRRPALELFDTQKLSLPMPPPAELPAELNPELADTVVMNVPIVPPPAQSPVGCMASVPEAAPASLAQGITPKRTFTPMSAAKPPFSMVAADPPSGIGSGPAGKLGRPRTLGLSRLGLGGPAWAMRLCSSACTAAPHSRSAP